MKMQGVKAIIPTELGAVSFTVPLIPPSVNHYKLPNGRGGYYVTKPAQAFIDAVCIFAKPKAKTLPIGGRYYHVEITVYVRRAMFHRLDSDNMEKLLFDALTTSGVIRDDRYVTYHAHQRLPVELAAQERTEYVVTGREEP